MVDVNSDPVVISVPSSSLMGTGTGSGLVVTPAGRANLLIKVISPIAIILVRAAKAFLDTMLGVMTAGPVTGLIPASDFGHLLIVSASFSVSAAGFSIIRSLIELFSKFDQSHPTLAS
jgi:hypothetical protein